MPIGDLRVGDEIVGFDEFTNERTKRRKSRIATVRKLGRAILPSFRIVTDKGALSASAEHMWLGRRVLTSQAGRAGYSWIETQNLKPGDSIQFLSKPWEEDRSYDAGRIRGFVEGEGSVGTDSNNGWPKPRINWAQRPGKLLNEINSLIAERGFQFTTKLKRMGVIDTDCTVNDLLGGWREVMRFLGTFRPTRLIERAREIVANHALDGRGSYPATVWSIEPIGEIEVVTIETSTHTLIAEGFLSHNCFGNHMPMARRWRHGPELEWRLRREIAALELDHPKGFAIRLHQLGDFYSVGYVAMWRELLERHPALHVFGFTARVDTADDEVAYAVAILVRDYWTRLDPPRFAIRFSNAPIFSRSTVTIESPVQKPADAVICPMQFTPGGKKAESCGSCALCWQSTKRVAFLIH